MTSTPTFIPADFFKQIETNTVQYGVGFIRMIFTILWAAFRPYLPYAIGILFIMAVVAMIKALLGQTGTLGSLLYHIFFFGILGVIIAIYGLDIVFNSYFELITFAIYVISYHITGLILKSFRRKY